MKVEVRQVMEHYEIYTNNEFYCSCDNRREVDEELQKLWTDFNKEEK